MSLTLRILLIVASVLMMLYALYKIRRAQLDIDDTVFWLLFPALLLVISIVPELPIWLSGLLGFASPANFVFLFVIAFLLFKLFLVSVELSVQKRRLSHLVQSLALIEERRASEQGENENKASTREGED